MHIRLITYNGVFLYFNYKLLICFRYISKKVDSNIIRFTIKYISKRGKTIIKVTAIIGSARKQHTYKAVKQFLERLQTYGDIEYEIVMLSEYNLQICKGCKLCLDKGEELCSLDDDRNEILEKMKNSDGIIFATPNYSFQISGLMKVFLDRLSFFLHRPQFFGKTYTSIVAQGIFGGKKIIKYLNQIGNGIGFNVVNGIVIKTLEPISKRQQIKNDKAINKLSQKYYSQLIKNYYPNPTLYKLMLFRMARTSIRISLDEEFEDYRYYKKVGWFESDYYYSVRLNLFKKILGRLFDKIAFYMAKSNNE